MQFKIVIEVCETEARNLEQLVARAMLSCPAARLYIIMSDNEAHSDAAQSDRAPSPMSQGVPNVDEQQQQQPAEEQQVNEPVVPLGDIVSDQELYMGLLHGPYALLHVLYELAGDDELATRL